ncbi:MAG TPA: hypothetical protein DDW23_02800 [Planctomycetes bacterium]|nr:hypothetical protein [Planctomycetota bacterium]
MSDTTPQISITAEPQVIPTNCLFRVDRSLGTEVLYTSDPDWAKEWAPLASAIFKAQDGVQGIRLGPAEVLITLESTPEDWRENARTLGRAIRTHLQEEGEVVKEGAKDALEGSDLTRNKAQQVIESELNPSLAAHGGWVEIQASKQTDLWITMGGGCQGCGAAAATMRQGVEVAIREAAPEVGTIHDATDHDAGTNPWI